MHSYYLANINKLKWRDDNDLDVNTCQIAIFFVKCWYIQQINIHFVSMANKQFSDAIAYYIQVDRKNKIIFFFSFWLVILDVDGTGKYTIEISHK